MIVTMNVAQAYDVVYAGLRKSPTLQRIWREHVLGGAYPNGFEHLSFLTMSELRHMAATLEIRANERVVDLACGEGGPGLWTAKTEAARLVGIDASTVGVAHAHQRAKELGLSSLASFAVGRFDRLPLRSRTADAIVSVDALQYAPDKAAAFAECARILRPGRRLAFTAFEIDATRTAGLPGFGADPVGDFRPLLDRAGFAIDTYEETAGWQERMASTYSAILAALPILRQEAGGGAAAALSFEISATLDSHVIQRRVFVVASRSSKREI
jgi:ubiquinone/menaquinone biosynthesis C-methylase UbiE